MKYSGSVKQSLRSGIVLNKVNQLFLLMDNDIWNSKETSFQT